MADHVKDSSIDDPPEDDALIGPINHFVEVDEGIKVKVEIYVPKCIQDGPDTKVTFVLQQTPYTDFYINKSISKFVKPLLQVPDDDVLGKLRDAFGLSFCAGIAILMEQGTHQSSGEFAWLGKAAHNMEVVANFITQHKYSNGVIVRTGLSAMGMTNLLASNEFTRTGGQWIGWAGADIREQFFEGGNLNIGVLGSIIPMVGVDPAKVMPLLVNNMYSSSWWKQRTFDDWSKVTWPAAFHAGWYDMFIEDNLRTWEAYRTKTDPKVRDLHRLTIDAFGHCMLGPLNPNLPPSFDVKSNDNQYTLGLGLFLNRFMMVQCYETTNMDDSIKCWSKHASAFKRITIYVHGSADNFVSSFDEWPKSTPRQYHLTKSKVLAIKPASALAELSEEQHGSKTKEWDFYVRRRRATTVELNQIATGCPVCTCSNPTVWPFSGCDVSCGAKCGGSCCCLPGWGSCQSPAPPPPPPSDFEGNISYVYDPANPAPALGGHFFAGNCGPVQQNIGWQSLGDRPWCVTCRNDVLTFIGNPLPEDYAILGNVKANLQVSTNATNTSFIVHLIDEYSDGKQYLVTSGSLNMAFREGWEKAPLPMTPGKPTPVQIRLNKMAYVFAKGHRMGISILSSSFTYKGPGAVYGLYPNPNNDAPPPTQNIFDISDIKRTIALNTIHLEDTSITFPEVQVSDLPKPSWIKQSSTLIKLAAMFKFDMPDVR